MLEKTMNLNLKNIQHLSALIPSLYSPVDIIISLVCKRQTGCNYLRLIELAEVDHE